MSIFRLILGGAFSFILIFVGVGLFLPRVVHVERQLVIAADAPLLYDLVDDFQSTSQWSPWVQHGDLVDYQFLGPDQGVGNKMIWTSDHPNLRSGSQEIVEVKQDRLVRQIIQLCDHCPPAMGYMKLTPEGSSTQVIWGFKQDLGMNPLARYHGLVMPYQIRQNYDDGLINLAQLANQIARQNRMMPRPLQLASLEQLAMTSFVPEDDQPVLMPIPSNESGHSDFGKLGDLDPEEFAAHVAALEPAAGSIVSHGIATSLTLLVNNGPLGAERWDDVAQALNDIALILGQQGLRQSGYARLIHSTADDGSPAVFAALPIVREVGNLPQGVGTTQSYSGRAVRGIHRGPYDQRAETYELLNAFIHAQGWQLAGEPWEEYDLTNLESSNSPELVRIYIPISETE